MEADLSKLSADFAAKDLDKLEGSTNVRVSSLIKDLISNPNQKNEEELREALLLLEKEIDLEKSQIQSDINIHKDEISVIEGQIDYLKLYTKGDEGFSSLNSAYNDQKNDKLGLIKTLNSKYNSL